MLYIYLYKNNKRKKHGQVVGPAELREHISDGLHKCAKEREWSIEVHKCESIDQLLKHDISICIDYIIFVFDSKMSVSLEQVNN